MSTIKKAEHTRDFESFYANKIQPVLNELSQKESAFKNWQLFTILTGVAAFGSFLLFYLRLLSYGHILAGILMGLCVAGVLFTAKYSDRFIEGFKEKIIRQIIMCIYPNAIYKPMNFISNKEYKASGLYRRIFTHYDGDDFWQCIYNGMTIHCSELNTRRQETTGVEYIFKGLFFSVVLNKIFSGAVYIWDKNNIQLPGSIADEHYRMFPLHPVNKLAQLHEGFNKHFSVYTNNENLAHTILNTAMLDHMLLLKQRLKKEISFSFVAGRCYVAVPFEESLLEPSVKGVRDKEAIKNYFFTILLVFNIIKKLELGRLA